MTFDFPLLFLGLLLLWFPRAWMRLGKLVGRRRRRQPGRYVEPWREQEQGDPRLNPRKEFAKPRNYFDLLRGLAGGLAIFGSPLWPAAVTLAGNAPRAAALQLLVLKFAVLTVGLVIQTLRFDHRRVTFFAPIFYLAGLGVALCGPWAALFGFLLVWTINPMFGSAGAFLAMQGALLGAFGVLFRDTPRLSAALAFGLCLLPVFGSLLLRRPLVVFMRTAKRRSGG
jgi:hypothetical protein